MARDKVLDACTGETRLAIELLAITGARRSEVADLRRCDIEADGRRVHLRLTGKTGTRRFPLPEPVAGAARVHRGRFRPASSLTKFPGMGGPMPGTEPSTMTERLKFIARYLQLDPTMTDLCAAFGVSRQTGYKWFDRWREVSPAGLHEQSRARKTHANPYTLTCRRASSRCARRSPRGGAASCSPARPGLRHVGHTARW